MVSLTTNKADIDYYHQKLNVRVALQELENDLKLRILGKFQ